MGTALPTAKTQACAISDAAQALNAAIRAGTGAGLTVALLVTELSAGASPQVVVTVSGPPTAFDP